MHLVGWKITGLSTGNCLKAAGFFKGELPESNRVRLRRRMTLMSMIVMYASGVKSLDVVIVDDD